MENSMSNNSRRFPFAHALSQLLRVILPVAALFVSAEAARGQTDPIGEGAKVRISVPGSKTVTGLVKSRTADSTTIFVEGYGGTRRFLNSDITELKVSQGRTRMEGVKKGALWGGGIGAVFAGLQLLQGNRNNDYEYNYASDGEIATSFLIGGLLWGVGIGAFVKAEHWETVPVHPHFAISPSSGSVGFSVALSPSFLH
jgi:hypothetical protein